MVPEGSGESPLGLAPFFSYLATAHRLGFLLHTSLMPNTSTGITIEPRDPHYSVPPVQVAAAYQPGKWNGSQDTPQVDRHCQWQGEPAPEALIQLIISMGSFISYKGVIGPWRQRTPAKAKKAIAVPSYV